MRVGMLVIATNKYMRFVQPLLDSARKYFLPGHDVRMFVFTNHDQVPEGTTRVFQEHTPFPGPTLMRYHYFDRERALYEDMDYLFYSDADMRFVDVVGDEVLSNRVAVVHPGFYSKPRGEFSYETRKESRAFVSPSEGSRYFAGGFNGGKASTYLSMARTIKERVDDDMSRGIVAVWHDESHMNRYMIDNPPSVALTPSYCYPEEVSIPFPKKLLALYKNHAEVRG